MAEPARIAAPDPFAAHIAMRERLAAARREGALALIDVGSSKISVLIVEIDLGESGYASLRVIGAGQQRSRGVRLGAISDMEEAERAIRAAVNQAERAAGRTVFHAVTTLTGAYPRSHALAAEVAAAGGMIGGADLSRALAACRLSSEQVGLGEGREVLHAAPVNWSVDSEQGVADPRGLSGRRLGVDLHVLTVADSAMANIAHCLHRVDLELASVVSTPFASGLACLVEEELEDGAACVDMGGGATAVSMFLRDKLVFADLVRMGGEHVTLDIVRAFGLSQPDAERLKTLEGSAITLDGAARDLLDLEGGGAMFADGAQPTRSDLSAVIRPRVEETLELARDRLEQAGLAYLPSRRVVLTGGAAQLTGVIETAQRVFGRRARLGRPMRLSGLPPACAGPAFSGVAGLAAYAVRSGDGIGDLLQEPPLEPAGPLGSMWRWLCDSW